MLRITQLLYLLMGAILLSCQLKTDEKEQRSGDSRSDAIAEMKERETGEGERSNPLDRPAGVKRNSILIDERASGQFDGKGGHERFRVVLMGDSVLSGTVAFTITNGEGELIYTDEFPALMLAASYDESVNSPQAQEALIKKRLGEFFNEDRFKPQAIEGDQPPHDAYYIKKETYNDLKIRKAPGFLYLIGKENTKHIAWSALEGKVVMYYNCC